MDVLMWPARRNRERNPYMYLLTRHLEALGVRVTEFDGLPGLVRLVATAPSIFHVHWPDNVDIGHPVARVARAAAFLGAVWLARLRGTRLVWTIHELDSLERDSRVGRLFHRLFVRSVDAYVSLSEVGHDLAEVRHPRLARVPSTITEHGSYRGMYANDVTREAARSRLGIDAAARVISFVGRIRPYKNVEQLLEAFGQIEDPGAVLLVAGELFEPERVPAFARAAAHDRRIRLDLRFIPANELQVSFGASDLVVLPFAEILNSGSALLALSFSRPVLVPNIGAMPALKRQFGDEWVRTYEGRLDAGVLARAIEWAVRPRGERAPDSTPWSEIARCTLELYERASAARQRSRR